MYKHIGKKIKFFAIFCFILGLLAALAVGVTLVILGILSLNVSTTVTMQLPGLSLGVMSGPTLIVTGALIIIVGFLASWIGSWYTYGMGEMIENTDKMVEMQNELINRLGGVLQQQQQQIAVAQQAAADVIAASSVSAPVEAPVYSEPVSEDVPVAPIE